MQISHNILFNQSNIIILVPFGLFVHNKLLDAKEGEIVELNDSVATLLSVTEISVKTDLANSLSLAIYGLPISVIMGKMIDNWGERIWKDKVMVVVIKK